MNFRQPILLIAVTAILICPLISRAQQFDLGRCLAIEDPKARLNCFDKAAPLALTQIADLTSRMATSEAEPQSKERTGKAAESSARQNQQLKHSKDALRELRKMASATEVGVSYSEYSRRIIDVVSNVRESSAEIEDPLLKRLISDALAAYTDAGTLWNGMLQDEYIRRFFQNYGSVTEKYGVTIAVYSDRNTTFRRLGMSQVLSPVWSAGKGYIEQAEAMTVRK